MDKYVIEKYFKGHYLGLVGDVIYHSKEKAEEIRNTLQNSIWNFTNTVKYKIKQIN